MSSTLGFGSGVPPFGCDDPTSILPCIFDGSPPLNPPTQITNVISPPVITINNAVNVGADAFAALSDSVYNAINNAVNLATDVARTTSHEISDSMGILSNNILDSVTHGLGQIWDFLKQGVNSILGNMGSILKTILDHTDTLLKGIASTLLKVIGPIADTIQKIATTVQEVNDKIIQPLTTTILTTISTIGTLTQAIETDLHDGLKGILQIPTDIANGLGSLSATMNRTVQQIGSANKEIVDVNLTNGMEKAIGQHVKSLGDLITSVSGADSRKTSFSDHVKLPEPDISGAGAATFDAIWKNLNIFVTDLFSFGKPSIDALKTAFHALPFLLGDAIELPVLFVGITVALAEMMEPLLKFMQDDIRAKAGVDKLSPGDAIQAYVRQFIDKPDLEEELSIHGWDKQRIQVILDLQKFLADVSTAMDWFHRGIIKEDDLRQNMSDHAITKEDQDALLLGSYRLFDVQQAVRAFNYGEMTEDQLADVLRVNRYTQTEIEVFTSTLLRREGVEALIERHRRNTLYSNHLTQDPFFNDVPGDVIEAAQRDGLSPQFAADAWMNQFAVPPLAQWLNLYFRGVRTHTELYAAMDYFRVPVEWRDDFIQANRSLIPFRTIPTMLSQGIIDEAYAKQQLQAHGFDLTAVNALLKYAAAKKKAPSATTASALHGLSVTTAKTFWGDGALTDAQYEDVLKAHGYTQEEADLSVKVEALAAHAKARKQEAQDIVNEALSGLITDDAAAQRLAVGGYTIAEQGKYLKQLRTARKQAAKLPSESDLHAFLKSSIIEIEDYKQGIKALGYADQWVEAFALLRAPLPADGG